MSAVRPSLLAAALALGALLAPGAARAQVEPDTLPALRDTIVFGTPLDGDSSSVSGDEAPARPSRWAEPFAVRASGRVAPRPPAREVVWLHPDSARKLAAASSDTAAEEDSESEADSAASGDEVELDTASARPRRSTRVAARDTADAEERPATRRTTARRDTTASEERPTRRASSRDTASAEERPTTRRASARRDTAASEEPPTRRTASRDEAAGGERPARSTTTAAGGSRARTHTVARGETFYGIARRYGVTSAQLRALNPDLDWQNLEVGDVLRLPARARTPGQSTTTASGSANREGSSSRQTPASATSTRRRTHTVERGETLFGLARRYGVTVEAIRRANDLEEDAGLRTGQTLVIPAAPRSR